ncbi:MAG TPA: OmpA family protein [Enhygromyxa sp.]|nr:OmpA family protein [Enhygromyxa sp.]
MNLQSIGIAVLTASISPSLALASPPTEAEGSVGVEGPSTPTLTGEEPIAIMRPEPPPPRVMTESEARRRLHLPWIKRWAPEPSMGELGVYGGAYFPSPNHELYDPDPALPDQGFRQLARAAGEVGLRFGYYPSRFIGLEAEGGVMPTRLLEVDDPALLYTYRGQLVLQLGLWSVTPFVLVGGGAIGIVSDDDVLGRDIDPLLHFGGGVKFYLSRYVQLRIEARDVVSHKRGVIEIFNGHNAEVLVGLAITLGRDKHPPRSAPDPVAYEISDLDNDTVPDHQDLCPNEPETINGYLDEDGCPEIDSDGDGIWDQQDLCPNEAETFNGYLDEDGCPETDRDGDGIWDEQDACPDQPETFNGFQDQDGCPDEVPAAVTEFTGTIRDITFETNSDALRPTSIPTLERAVGVLEAYPDIRMEITGHTDDRGDRDHNLDLSRRRAEAVRTYLVEHGIDESRITTVGLGPDQPIDTNNTRTGRANNRRIEFKVIQPGEPTPMTTPRR